jgi:predicted deacylase
MSDAPIGSDPNAIEELIARVLSRAHEAVEDLHTSHEARALLHVAHSFADELAGANPQFDRIAFIRAATGANGETPAEQTGGPR